MTNAASGWKVSRCISRDRMWLSSSACTEDLGVGEDCMLTITQLHVLWLHRKLNLSSSALIETQSQGSDSAA